MLEFKCDNYKSAHVFLVVPYRSCDVILGNDWNLENGLIINYNNKSISIKNKEIPAKLVLFEHGTSEKLITTQKDEMTFIYVIEVNNINFDMNETSKEFIEARHAIGINTSKCDIEYNKNIGNLCRICYNEGRDDAKEILEGEKITNIINNGTCRDGEKCASITITNKIYRVNLSEELRSAACKLTGLTESQNIEFMNLLVRKQALFVEKVGCALGYQYKIKLTKENPIIHKSYSVPLGLREQVKNKIDEMLKAGIIERSVSPHCNPLRIVKKSNGDIRVCLDARFLNQVVEDDHESPPIISEILQEYHGVNFYSKLDLTNGYWQIPLEKESRPYTAFLFNSTIYQFTRVPFGLKTAGSAFIRALKNALKCGSEKMHRAVENYVDDILIGTKSFEEHLLILEEIFTILLKFNFILNIEKCEFLKNKITFLGFIISVSGVVPDPEKLAKN